MALDCVSRHILEISFNKRVHFSLDFVVSPLCVPQCCQFVVINPLLGFSLVPNVQAATAHCHSYERGSRRGRGGQSVLPVSKGKLHTCVLTHTKMDRTVPDVDSHIQT